MSRQFVECVFHPGGRAYAYHWDRGEDRPPLFVGDKVKVENKGGGEKTVTVAALLDKAPPFATKPIIGPAPVEAAKE